MSTEVERQGAQVESLLRQANAAARIGDTIAARDAYWQVLDLQPDSIDALLGLAGVAESLDQKREYFERVIGLDPNNADARAGLDLIARRLAAANASAAEIDGRAAVPAPEVMYCANHPNVETRLRCNRCGKPICPRCGELTPVGYRCRECVRGQLAVYYTATPLDPLIALIISAVLGGIAAFIVGRIGLFGWFILIFVSPVVGAAIAEVAHRAVGRRRGPYNWIAVAGGLLLGAIVANLDLWMFALFGGARGLGAAGFQLLGLGLYLVLAIGAAISRLRLGR